MIDVPPETPHQQPVAASGGTFRAIAVTRSGHGSAGFTNLMVSTRGGAIVLDSHGADSCVVTLDEAAVTALFDLLGERRRTSAPLPEGAVHPLAEPCPGWGATSDVRRITSTSPQPFLDRLAATVEQLNATRSLLRQIIALADDSATLSNGEPRDRLTALAEACACVRVLTTASEGGR